MTTFIQSYNDILDLFKAVWDGTGYVVIYPNVETEIPTTRTPWARVTVEHVSGEQANLQGSASTTRYTRNGIFTVQIFVPVGEGINEALTLGKTILDAYEGVVSTTGVWFRNGTLSNAQAIDGWFQVNATIDFIYDEVK